MHLFGFSSPSRRTKHTSGFPAIARWRQRLGILYPVFDDPLKLYYKWRRRMTAMNILEGRSQCKVDPSQIGATPSLLHQYSGRLENVHTTHTFLLLSLPTQLANKPLIPTPPRWLTTLAANESPPNTLRLSDPSSLL